MKNYVYTDLSARNSVILEIDGTDYAIAQFTASWAANEIPTAAAMLTIGREARTQTASPTHRIGQHAFMALARVFFVPDAEYSHVSPWPAGRFTIFEGFFTGFAYRKVNGKVHVVANLLHWLAALTFSSSLNRLGHPTNPTELNAAAVLGHVDLSGAGLSGYIASVVPSGLVADKIHDDLWSAIKGLFCALANVPTASVGPEGLCGGVGDFSVNDKALSALSRIEGPVFLPEQIAGGFPVPVENCSLAYKWGVPLEFDTLGMNVVEDSVADAIGQEMIESYSSATFWDKLVGQFCPMFGMAIVPMAETAIVVADTPTFNGDFWRQIPTFEYDAFDMSAELHRPLRAVGVVSGYESKTMPGIEGRTLSEAVLGGCHVEDRVGAGTGGILYVSSPPWLRSIQTQPGSAGFTVGVDGEVPIRNAAAADINAGVNANGVAGNFGPDITKMYQRYAQDVYVNNMLRGRMGSLSGKLRFDIAPLSIIRVVASTEKFIGGEDDLAATIVGCVQRVTISINAESAMAGTTIVLSHVRTEAENADSRTSVTEHPLFGKSIHGAGKHGSPLVDGLEFELDDNLQRT